MRHTTWLWVIGLLLVAHMADAQQQSTVDYRYPHSECTNGDITKACVCTGSFTTSCSMSDGTPGQKCAGNMVDASGASLGACDSPGTCCTESLLGTRFRSQVITPLREDIASLYAHKLDAPNGVVGNSLAYFYGTSGTDVEASNWLINSTSQALTGVMSDPTNGLIVTQTGAGSTLKAQNGGGTRYVTIHNGGATHPAIAVAAGTDSGTPALSLTQSGDGEVLSVTSGAGLGTLTVGNLGQITTTSAGAPLTITSTGSPALINTSWQTTGVKPTLDTDCGSGASVATGSTDSSGTLTMGTGSPTACTVIFNIGFTYTSCVVNNATTQTHVHVSTQSSSGFTATLASGENSDVLNWICSGSQ